ncbi:MAG: inositol monophosphatase family protein, partial [Candidatus Promineifilaceae bacterium]
MDMDTLLADTVNVVETAAQAIMGFYQDSFTVAEKSPDNPVTDADLAADSILKEGLMKLLPEAGWLSEETADSDSRLTKASCWVVDPLDGTKEFVLGIPEFTISTALVQDGLPIMAVILNPVTSEIFTALRGQGSKYMGKSANVSERKSLAGARIDASRSERGRGEFEPFEKLVDITTM